MKKTNKTFKRFAAITSASLLAACAMAPVAFNAVAATPITEGSITITTPESDHSYRAYQIFDGDLSSETVEGVEKITFANIQWGSGVLEKITVDGTELSIYDALKNVNSAFSKGGAALTSAEEVSKVLETINSNIPGVTTFAVIDEIAAVFEQFKDTSKTNIINSAYDSANGKYVISIADPGYYLVEETKSGSALANGEAVTKYLLQVAGDALVSPKADAPKVMKKVLEDSKTTADKVAFNSATADYQLATGYNDVADYSIGEDFGFTLYGTLPTSFANYDGYYYQFTDTMGNGISLVDKNADTKIDENDFIVKIIDGTTTRQLEASEFKYVKTDDGFKIIIPDLKEIDMNTGNGTTFDAVSSSAIITVDYTAELNANAVIGNDGNPNDVYLTYSNNSNTAQGGLNDEGNGPKDEEEVGKTAKDYNVVFTYQLDVTKKLGESGLASDETGKKAGFRLYNADKSKVATFDNANKFTGWVDSVVDDGYETAGNEIFTTADGTFNFIGLQDGTYYLTETTVPTGYNRMEDKKVVIAADTSNAAADTCQNYIETLEVGKALTALNITVDDETKEGDIANGTVAMSITNNKGNELPGTGGIGTTIFYLGGGAMAAIGGIYLISKRRMKKSEE